MERLKKARQDRRKSNRSATRKLADIPPLFGKIRQPEGAPYLLILRVSSDSRGYIPIGFLDASTIAGVSALIIPHATLYHFAILTSSRKKDRQKVKEFKTKKLL